MGAAIGNSLLYPIVGFATCVAFVYLSFGNFRSNDDYIEEVEFSFVKRNGTRFVVDDKAFYVNGWNSYWFMDQAVDLNSRWRVASMLQSGAKMGLTVCRTWAFNDGEYNSLQIAPGRFDERVFQVLVHNLNYMLVVSYLDFDFLPHSLRINLLSEFVESF